jgi:hypothetical protein
VARESFPRGLVQRLAEAGANPTKSLTEFREAGGKLRTQTWYRMWGEIENERSLAGIEEGKPLHLRPTEGEIMPMTTRRASGYMQRVQVVGRLQGGGMLTKTIDIRTDKLVSRINAVGKARGIVEGIGEGLGRVTDSVPVAVIAALYGGTYELNPEPVS